MYKNFFLDSINLKDQELVSEYHSYFFTKVLADPAEIERVWNELFVTFEHSTPEFDFEHRGDAFLWFMVVSWKRIESLSMDIVANHLIRRQFLLALLYNINVWDNLLWYISNRSVDKVTMSLIYEKIRDALLQSDAKLTSSDSSKYKTLSEILDGLEKINNKQSYSLEIAEYSAYISRIVTEYTTIDPIDNIVFKKNDIAVKDLVAIGNFFLGVKGESIWYLLDPIVHPYSYPELTDDASEGFDSLLSADHTNNDKNEKNGGKVSSFEEIRLLIESRFPYDNSGQFTNLEGVLAMLDTLAEEQGDERIRDLYVYDEMTGVFRWNGELLGDSNNI